MTAPQPVVEMIAGLAAVAQAGFQYAAVKDLGAARGWRLDVDEPNFGFVTFTVAAGIVEESRLCVFLEDKGQSPRAMLPLSASEDYEKNKVHFDAAFAAYATELAEVIGLPGESGSYEYRHRPGWPYRYATWFADNATFVLVQDEFDIQFGMDVTLWAFLARIMVRLPFDN